MSFQSKNKILIILPTNHNNELKTTLKINELIEIIQPLEKENYSIKLATYRGQKPYFNFDESERNKEWINHHDEQLASVSNIDNINSDIFDAIIIPSYLNIYEEIQIKDYHLISLVTNFIEKDKIIVTYEHSSYILSKCSPGNWPLVGYNICGISFEKSLVLQEELQIPNSEEEICLLGGNYIKNEDKERGDNKEVFCLDRGILTGCDPCCIRIMMMCLIGKLNSS